MLNRLLHYKKITMSIPEFCAYSRGEINLNDIYINRSTQRILNKMCKNNNFKKIMVFFLANILILNTSFTACAVDTTKIDNLGRTILTLVQSIGYWFCIIMASKEILTALLENRSKDVGGIILKHLIAFGGFYALPWCFDLIKELLG